MLQLICLFAEVCGEKGNEHLKANFYFPLLTVSFTYKYKKAEVSVQKFSHIFTK